MLKNINAFLSSVTGNTSLVCDGVIKELSKRDINVTLYKNAEDFPSNIKYNEPNPTVMLFFWCYRGGLDPINKNIISNLKNCNILCIGTMGGNAESSYGVRVKGRVCNEITESGNNVISVFMCRGKIPPERTAYRHSLPKDNPSYLDYKGVLRHREAATHPDENDIANAIQFALKYLHIE